MTDAVARPRFESAAVLATVLRSPALLRTQLAYVSFTIVEYSTFLAMLVYAYDQGGATASGLVSFAQLAPAVVFAPLIATLGDRFPHVRMLASSYLMLALAHLLVAVLLLTGQPPLAVYAGAVIAGLSITTIRPAHASVMPEIATTPSELTAANVATGTMDNTGVIVGSLGGGILLAAAGAGGVYLVAGLLALASFGLVARLRTASHGTGWRSHLHHADAWHSGPEHDRLTGADRVAELEAAMPRFEEAAGGLAAEMAAGLRAGLANHLIRPLVVLISLSFLLQGTADVFQVVIALDVVGMGEGGVGLLAAAIGVGGLVGAAAAVGLVGRRRLAGALMVAAFVAGAGLAVPALVPLPAAAVLGFLVVGAGRSVVDVSCRTLLQRVTPERYLTRVFGLVEGATSGALAVGALLAPALVTLVGPASALLFAALLLPAGALLLRAALRRSEAAGVVHEAELAAIRRIGMFTPLPLPVLERLAAHADRVHVPAGTPVVTEGDPGDCFYMIDAGEAVVTWQGKELSRVGPGQGFGEIALLRDVPRTATVTALTDMDLFALDRHPFLEALTGQSAAYAIAHRVADEHLSSHH